MSDKPDLARGIYRVTHSIVVGDLRNPLISRKAVFEAFWPSLRAKRRAVSFHGEHGATSFSIIRNPEPALQDSSYESRHSEAPISGCILALEKMRG